MAWQPTIYLLPVTFATVLSLLLAAIVGRRSDSLAHTFAVLMFATGIWALATALEFGLTSIEGQSLWNRIGYFGAVVVPTAWFLLTLQYAGYESWLTRRTVGALAIEPGLTLAFVWTNEYHHLVWSDISQVGVSGIVVLEQTFGPWYWINLSYSYLLVVAGLGFLLRVLLQSNPIYRRQSAVLVLGAVVPLGANVAFNFGITDLPVDLTTFTFSISGMLFAFALFYYDLLDLEPVARDVLVEEMGNPVVVMNAKGVVVDTNPAARRVFAPALRAGEPAPPSLLDGSEPVQGEVYTATIDGQSRTYHVRTTLLHDHRDELVGSLVVMDDVTDLRNHEQRLTVLNRVLRHNVRNELTIVLGHLDMVGERLSDDSSVEIARKHAQRVVNLSEQARNVVETLHREGGHSTRVDVDRITELVTGRFRETHPNVEIECDIAPVRVAVTAEDLLDVALDNLIENAIVHNDAAEPTVWVECALEDEYVHISVADDGPGIPAVERSVFAEGDETPLQHGSGLGLWLVHWIVTASGGELQFEENDPRGSVVTLRLERADES